MDERGISITEFVRGMAWHDVGKPFALGTPRHAALGHWVLHLAGYDGEAFVALAHGHNRENIEQSRRQLASRNPKKVRRAQKKLLAEPLLRYFRHGGDPIPGLLVLCNSLDHMAASVYSLQSKGLQTECHSMQNPFSRLPTSIPIPGLLKQFTIRKLPVFEKYLWRSLQRTTALSEGWRAILSMEAKKAVEDPEQPLPAPTPLPGGEDALKVILRYMAHYPERTYPSVNDTSLEQHCRLSGVLAFVVYRNLERSEADLIHDYIRYTNGEIQYPVPNPEEVVHDHLAASLVRVAFEGHRWLHENAVRVDDLHGARELAVQTREAFKQALAVRLGAPDLAEFLTISESQFDLFYLLPPADASLESVIHSAYETAIGQVTAQVAHRLERDFPQIAGLRSQLRRQLSDVGYGLRVIPVEVPKEVHFNKFAAEYGSNLLRAYVDGQDYVAFPQASLPDEANWHDYTEPLAVHEACEVCGNYPILTPPDSLGDEDKQEWKRKRDYAGHVFRGEREEICLSCVARRTLAYGKIARRMDHLVQPMLERVETGQWRRLPASERARSSNGPDLPPLLASSVRLTEDDELADVNAFYVRYRRTRDGVDRSTLDIFPTTSYAADATGNVVLLSLLPTEESLFACYAYDKALNTKVEQSTSESLIDSDQWWDTFVRFYQNVAGSAKTAHLAEPIRHVYPHLARVMERIQRIQIFYDDLYHRLAEMPPHLRVLPLDTEFPTLRLLVPADELDKALRVLNQVMTETLFSATYFKEMEKRRRSHELLQLLVPDLLHGAIILFKQKFPLYLALEAERALFQHLATTDNRAETSDRPSRSDWYGLRLAFTDLRGTLSQVGPVLAEATHKDLGAILDLTRDVDRRTVLLQAETAEYISTELADALTVIRANRVRLSQDKVRELTKEETFAPVLFLKRAIRG